MAEERAVTKAAEQMPGYWRFVWMFFMQPLTLHDLSKACGVDQPGVSGWRWWRQRRQFGGIYGRYIQRLVFILLVVPVIGVLVLWLCGAIFHIPINWFKVGISVAGAVAVGVIGSVAGSVAFGVAVGVTGGVPLGVVGDMPPGIALGVVLGVVGGVASNLAGDVAGGLRDGMVGGFGTVLGGGLALAVMMGMGSGVAGSVVLGVAGGVALGVAFIASHCRLVLYPFELTWQLLAKLGSGAKSASDLAYSPLMYHDLSYLPYPFLVGQILAAAEYHPTLAKQAIRIASRSPGQKRSAASALNQLRANELRALAKAGNFTAIADLHGLWLPGNENDSTLLSALAANARFMQAGLGASTAHISLQHFNAASQALQAIDNQLLSSKEPIARFLPPVLQTWREVLETARSEAAAKAKDRLPNPFVVGTPLKPEMSWGQAVFRGRETLIQQVETLLADQQNTTSIALIGPRRCGKSSLLNMLRVMLPDTIVVLFDLQANPVNTPAAFYQALANAAQIEARLSHRLSLPALPQDEKVFPIEALKQWLDQLEQFATEHRILICIDEFERLETLFPADQSRELLQLMGLFRATIQHGRRVRLLIAGAAPFDELGTIWNDHFINLREMRLGFLDQATTIALLTKPIPEFPDGAIPSELAQEIYRRSRGQPFLTQTYGHALVETLNRDKRTRASMDDLEQIEPELLSSYTYYFRGIWQEVPATGQAALTALANHEPITLEKETKRWLRRRMLVDEDGQLLVPLFGRWIREKDEMV